MKMKRISPVRRERRWGRSNWERRLKGGDATLSDGEDERRERDASLRDGEEKTTEGKDGEDAD